MKIALIGYGKMGHTIEALGKEQGHEFPLLIDLDNPDDLNAERIREVEVAIEFTSPASAPGNLLKCFKLGLPVVCGSTGWNDRLEEIEKACKEQKGALFHASNFSIGVNILFAMNRRLAAVMNRFPEYSPSLEEVHHIHKLDAPSGTAITLAEGLIEEMDRIEGWSMERKANNLLPVNAIREGEVKGKHSVTYTSALDTISLSHDAFTRDAFASGALLAAGFIRDRKGVFGMRDLLDI